MFWLKWASVRQLNWPKTINKSYKVTQSYIQRHWPALPWAYWRKFVCFNIRLAATIIAEMFSSHKFSWNFKKELCFKTPSFKTHSRNVLKSRNFHVWMDVNEEATSLVNHVTPSLDPDYHIVNIIPLTVILLILYQIENIYTKISASSLTRLLQILKSTLK